MSRFTVEKTPIEGLHVLQRQPLGDTRGYLERMFCSEELEPIIGQRRIIQVNHTLTEKAGTVRGMHFQYPPYAEMKLVSCLRGKIFDVALDLRKGSSTFLHWHAEFLTETGHKTFVIPEGFAHGFQTLTDDCEILYLHTSEHNPAAEAGLDALDPGLAITWPMPITERSKRDQESTLISSEFSGFLV